MTKLALYRKGKKTYFIYRPKSLTPTCKSNNKCSEPNLTLLGYSFHLLLMPLPPEKSIKVLILVLDLDRKVGLGRDAFETLYPWSASESLSVF